MQIALVSALLLGLAAARNTLMSFTNTRIITGSNGIFDISYKYNFESTYGTAYNVQTNAVKPYLIEQSYELNFDTFATVAFTFNIAGLFTLECEVDADLLDVTPYRQWVSFVRPDAILYGDAAAFDLTLSAEREVSIGQVVLTHTPDTQVFAKSIYDWTYNFITQSTATTVPDVLPASADWGLQGLDIAITDTYYGFDLASTLGFDTAIWYGLQQWYTVSLSDFI